MNIGWDPLPLFQESVSGLGESASVNERRGYDRIPSYGKEWPLPRCEGYGWRPSEDGRSSALEVRARPSLEYNAHYHQRHFPQGCGSEKSSLSALLCRAEAARAHERTRWRRPVSTCRNCDAASLLFVRTRKREVFRSLQCIEERAQFGVLLCSYLSLMNQLRSIKRRQ